MDNRGDASDWSPIVTLPIEVEDPIIGSNLTPMPDLLGSNEDHNTSETTVQPSDYIKPNPDLYGPVWICVTLMFATAITGNISDYFHTDLESSYHWKYDFHTVTTAATVIFVYAWMLPCILWFILHWYGSEYDKPKLVEIISLYGYCLAVFVPLSALWLVPKMWFKWTITLIGSTASGLVLTKSLLPTFTKKMYPVLLILLVLHVYVASMFMIKFFHLPLANLPVEAITPAIKNLSQPISQ